MSYRKILNEQYNEFSTWCDLLTKFVNNYRLLIGGAGELNNISYAKKSDVEEAIRRADKAGEIIDNILEMIEKSGKSYFKYCKIKNEYISAKANKDIILTEIDYELDFNNNQQGEDRE